MSASRSQYRVFLQRHLFCLPCRFYLVCPLPEFSVADGVCGPVLSWLWQLYISLSLLCIEGQPWHWHERTSPWGCWLTVFLELQMSCNCINMACTFLIPACLISHVGCHECQWYSLVRSKLPPLPKLQPGVDCIGLKDLTPALVNAEPYLCRTGCKFCWSPACATGRATLVSNNLSSIFRKMTVVLTCVLIRSGQGESSKLQPYSFRWSEVHQLWQPKENSVLIDCSILMKGSALLSLVCYSNCHGCRGYRGSSLSLVWKSG